LNRSDVSRSQNNAIAPLAALRYECLELMHRSGR
jgi:hypothetical protein